MIDAGNGTAAASAGRIQTTMLGLLWDAFSGMSHGFQAERDPLGLTMKQGRVLSLIERHPGAGLEAIAQMAYLSPQGVEDADRTLIAAGYVTAGPAGGWMATTQGCENAALLLRAGEPETRERVLRLRTDLHLRGLAAGSSGVRSLPQAMTHCSGHVSKFLGRRIGFFTHK